MKGHVLILNYHAIGAKNCELHQVDPIYSLNTMQFRRQLDCLKELAIKVLTIDEIVNDSSSDELVVCLTFDDGHKSDYDVVLPILNEYNYKATFFPTLLNFNKDQKELEKYKTFINLGHCIGSHGVNHKYLSLLKTTEQYQELIVSKAILEAKIDDKIKYFALPGGKYNRKTIELAKQVGYEHILSTDFGLVNSNHLSFVLNRWSIKKKTTLKEFENVLMQKKVSTKKKQFENGIKRTIAKILGSKLTDIINYKFNS